MSRATILTGTGRYEDRWHDYPATSQQIALVLGELGLECQVRGTRTTVLSDLDDTDLLVVNSGNGRLDPEFDGSGAEWESASTSLRDYLARGGAAIGIHMACNTLHTVGGWLDSLGGHWEPGRSMHPPIDLATVKVCPDPHPITNGLASFSVFDERYSHLVLTAPVDILVTHEYDGVSHPLAWARQVGRSRIVFDALGHDPRSYESEARRRLLKREVLWLLGAEARELASV